MMELESKTVCIFENPSLVDGAYALRDLMDRICKQLEFRDLCSVAQTCRLWRQAVQREFQHRCPQQILVYENQNMFVFEDCIKLEPYAVILFVQQNTNGPAPREQTICQEYMNHFPELLFAIGADKVFTEKNIIDTEEYDESKSFVTLNDYEIPGILMPNHSSLEIKFTWARPQDIDNFPVEEILRVLIPINREWKTILIILTQACDAEYLAEVATTIQNSFSKGRYTLWGGELFNYPCGNKFKIQNGYINYAQIRLLGISITTPNIESYTLVLEIIKDLETDYILNEILRFKNRITLKGRSLALINAPVFDIFYDDSDEEEIWKEVHEDADDFYRENYEKRFLYYFKKVFPDVPFICTFYDSAFNVFGVHTQDGHEKLVHKDSFSVMILTYT